jgi:hypothetical protein
MAANSEAIRRQTAKKDLHPVTLAVDCHRAVLAPASVLRVSAVSQAAVPMARRATSP